MRTSDRAVWAILTVVCLVAVVPMTITALVQIIRLETFSAYRTCHKALTRFVTLVTDRVRSLRQRFGEPCQPKGESSSARGK